MAEFNIQSDSVDVTRIMEQIRQRIQEKRGRDYTEQQIRELATVKLERFLDPQQVRSDLVEHYRQLEPPEAVEPEPDRFEAWAQAIGPLAAHRNIACKLSGLLTEQPAGEEDPAVVRGWMDLMMAHFGPGRLVWGSDWPVVMLKASYRQWRDIAWNAVAAADRPAIFGGNAARLYRLART